MFKHIKGVLIDLSGTVHIDKVLVDGSKEAIMKLQQRGMLYKFVTNTTKESLQSLHDKLQSLQLDVRKDDIFTSLTAAKKLVVEKGYRPHLMLTDSALQDFQDIPNDDDPDAVVVGLSPQHYDYEQMNTAMNMLLNDKDAKLIAINKARYIMTSEGYKLGAGGFVTALEYATNKQAIIVGKPNKEFFLTAVKEMGLQPGDCVMIGDDVIDDVIGAIDAGLHGILVKTGKYKVGDEMKCEIVAENLNHAVDLILDGR